MYASSRGMFVERVATMLELAGVAGPTLIHLAPKRGCAVVELSVELTDDWAHETIDEAIAILDAVSAHGHVERPQFRYEP